MQVTNTSGNKYDYSQVLLMNRRSPGLQEENKSFGNAVEKVEKEEKGEELRICLAGNVGTIGHGIRAVLLEESTPDRPIIQVTSNYNGKREFFNVDINKVDPRNASQMEMFALCSYADEIGRGSGDSLGSYHTLTISADLARYNNYSGELNDRPPSWEQFTEKKIDWTATGRFTADVFKDSKDIKIRELVLWGNQLLNFFLDHIKERLQDESGYGLDLFKESRESGLAEGFDL